MRRQIIWNRSHRWMGIIAIFLLLGFLLNSYVIVSEASQSGSEDDHAFSNVQLQKESLPQAYTRRIEGFDVSDDGNVLLLLEDNHILIMDPEFKQIAYFSFHDLGKDYVFWEDEDFVLLRVRGGIELRYSVDGIPRSAQRMNESSPEYNSMLNALFHKQSDSANHCHYELRRDSGLNRLFAWIDGTYQSLIMITPDGAEQVIYQGKSIAGKFWLYVLFLHCIGGICVFRLILRKKSIAQSHKNDVEKLD